MIYLKLKYKGREEKGKKKRAFSLAASVYETYFVGLEKFTKQAFLFNYSDIDKIIFHDRNKALKIVKEAEKNKDKIFTEIYYEDE